jgi:phosphoribosyl-ATP pyrophosphohydrolase
MTNEITNKNIVKDVYNTLKSRRDNPIDSYTSNIMKDSDKLAEDKILEKVGEEAAELIIASKNNENLIGESADLIFHTLLLLVYKNVELEDLLKEFEKRHN